MPKPQSAVDEKRIGEEAVKEKTGKGWKAWFSLLDDFDVKEHGHTAAARFLGEKHKVGPWWRQMIVVEYEKDRGLRVTHQKGSTYEVSVARTIATSAARAYEAFTDPSLVSKWFTAGARARLAVGGQYSNTDGDEGVYLLVKPPQRVRFTWDNPLHSPGTVVEVRFASRGKSKVSVTLQHTKLKTRKEVEEMKTGWNWALDSFKSFLETGAPIRQDEWEKSKKNR